MIKFINGDRFNDMLQFIVNLLYLGMKSENICWAEANGTKEAVSDLLSSVPDDFIKIANDILLNGSITITDDRRLENRGKINKDIEEYQDIVNILRSSAYNDYFSENCKRHFRTLTKAFSVDKDLHILK